MSGSTERADVQRRPWDEFLDADRVFTDEEGTDLFVIPAEIGRSLAAALRAAEEALRAVRSMPNEHDLLTNAMAKAMWYVADTALASGLPAQEGERKRSWSDACPACKGYPDEPHTLDGHCLEPAAVPQEGKEPCLYPLPDGRRCLECATCQPVPQEPVPDKDAR